MKKITILLSILIYASGYAQSSTAIYDVSITTIWNSTDHTSVPSSAHWSPLVGATHKNPNDVLKFNVTAPLTNGIKRIAETGNTSDFKTEVENNNDANFIKQETFSPFAGNNSSASISGLEVTDIFHYVTLVSMVAPSPDWFIAVNNLDLRSGNPLINNGWKETFTIDVFAYDSGTDDGTDYESSDSPSNPRVAISMVSGPPINGKRMGTMTFTYNSSTLSNNTINTIEDLKVYPNPTKGNISISNIQNIELKTIEIYSVLGELVKQFSVKQKLSKLELDLSHFKNGMYLLKLSDSNGLSSVQKLLINR